MKNLFYIAGMFTLVFSPVNCTYDSGDVSLVSRGSDQEQTSSNTTTDVVDDHEPILKPTKP